MMMIVRFVVMVPCIPTGMLLDLSAAGLAGMAAAPAALEPPQAVHQRHAQLGMERKRLLPVGEDASQ